MLYTLIKLKNPSQIEQQQTHQISLPNQARQNPLASEPNKLLRRWPMTGLPGGSATPPPVLRRRPAE